MDAGTFIFILMLYKTLARQELDDYSNVGSVLFYPSDTRKKSWSDKEIALLRARQYFQSLIPPPSTINILNDDYVETLLRYFRDTYTAVKREAGGPDADSIMTRALSDTLGGYLKGWVLPITKCAFYGGTISQDNTVKLHGIYDAIKSYLDTEGDGWRHPNGNLLNFVEINVAPIRSISNIRSADVKACDSLAYFENTPSGLIVPLPHVNWQEKSSTMFVPLKNQTLIPLSQSNSSDSLFKYYDTAKHCIQNNNLEDRSNFDERFQCWLAQEVIPHLNDEHLYLALGSVLTLVNKTNSLCDTVIDLYGDKRSPKAKTLIAGIPIDLSSKKVIIITVLIFLEIAWCIPALLYILCLKIKKSRGSKDFKKLDEIKKAKDKDKPTKNKAQLVNKTKLKNAKALESPCGICDSEYNNDPKDLHNQNDSKHKITITIPKCQDDQTGQNYFKNKEYKGISLHQKPRSKHLQVQAVFSATSSKSSVGIGTRSNFCSQINIPVKTIHKCHISTPRNLETTAKDDDIVDINPILSPSTREVYCRIPEHDKVSFTTVQELESTKTVTLLKGLEKHVKKSRSANNCSVNKAIDTIGVTTLETTNQCTYVACRRETKATRRNHASKEHKTTSASRNDKETRVKQIEENQVVKVPKATTTILKEKESKARFHILKEIKSKESRKIISNDQHVEIRIDEPNKECFCVDITGSIKSAKPSKIPKRSYSSSLSQTVSLASKRTQVPTIRERESYGRSHIPQPKKLPVDDMAINTKTLVIEKLNTTL